MFFTNLVMIEQILLKNLLESNRKSTKNHIFQKMKLNGPQTVTKLCCSPRLVFQTRFAIFAKIWLKSIRSDCFLSQLCRYLPLKLIAGFCLPKAPALCITRSPQIISRSYSWSVFLLVSATRNRLNRSVSVWNPIRVLLCVSDEIRSTPSPQPFGALITHIGQESP